jgi:hypothetical protein
MQSAVGRLLIGLGLACFALLAYWIAALHQPLPGKEIAVRMYGKPRGRRGPPGIYVLLLGGLGLVAAGLKQLGHIEDLENLD